MCQYSKKKFMEISNNDVYLFLVLNWDLSICCIVLQRNGWCTICHLYLLMGDHSICCIVLQMYSWCTWCIRLRYFIIHRRIFLWLTPSEPKIPPYREQTLIINCSWEHAIVLRVRIYASIIQSIKHNAGIIRQFRPINLFRRLHVQLQP